MRHAIMAGGGEPALPRLQRAMAGLASQGQRTTRSDPAKPWIASPS